MLKSLALPWRKEKREWVLWTELPDGLNYFHGVHEVQMPTKTGSMPVLVNIWTIHFGDLKDHAGLFTKEEAEFYLSIIGMEGCFICTHSEAVDKRKGISN